MIHIFDFDLTIWETFSKHGTQIWAKQLIFPLHRTSKDEVVDDVGSVCRLRIGIREYLNSLALEKANIGYISSGRHWNFEDSLQPSLHLLNLFEIKQYFNSLAVLAYKTYKKSDFLKNIDDKIIFYDDDSNVLKDLSSIPNVITIDSKIFVNWNDLIGKKYA